MSKRLSRPPLRTRVSLLGYRCPFLCSAIPQPLCSAVSMTPRRITATERLHSLYPLHATASLQRVRTVNTLSFHSSYFLIVPVKVTVSPSSNQRVAVNHLKR